MNDIKAMSDIIHRKVLEMVRRHKDDGEWRKTTQNDGQLVSLVWSYRGVEFERCCYQGLISYSLIIGEEYHISNFNTYNYPILLEAWNFLFSDHPDNPSIRTHRINTETVELLDKLLEG